MEAHSSEDCPGFTPDSLLIRINVIIIRNQFGTKVIDFFIFDISFGYYFSGITIHCSIFRVLALKFTPILNNLRLSVSKGRA